MLKKGRVALATIVWLGITLLFLGIGQGWWGWMAKIQFLPAVLRITSGAIGLNIIVVGSIICLTLLFGRIYCSVICPLGISQDGIIWLRKKLYPLLHRTALKDKDGNFILKDGRKVIKKEQLKYRYAKENGILRYAVLILYLAALFVGIQVIVAMIAPYSSYGRIVRSIAQFCCSGEFGGPASPASWPLLLTGGISALVIGTIAWFTGRQGWCNSICPVGTVLSFFSRFALIHPVIDESKCNGCHNCEKHCPARCIDSDSRSIDYSRCVDCFDCIEVCSGKAISMGRSKKGSTDGQPEDKGRRAFIQGSALAVGAAAAAEVNAIAQDMKLDGGLADVIDKQAPARSERLVPPGSRSAKDFYSRCTACQLCVSACPNGVLRPSTDLKHFMQPEMSYEKGYCRPECTACSDICPAGAILPVTPEAKTAVHIGRAVIDYDLCVVNRDKVACGNCYHHCPSGAIEMVEKEGSAFKIPAVIEDRCIGCGACEFLCPSRPLSAIHVNGLHTHITA